MAQPNIQSCVLCLGAAEYRWADNRKRKHFFCNACVEYQITDTAEKKVAAFTPEFRKSLSDKARSLPKDMVLVIFVPQVAKVDETAHESLRAEPTPRAKLPRMESTGL